MLVFLYYNDAVQRHEQRCCWNGALEKINIIIIIQINSRVCEAVFAIVLDVFRS